MLKWGEVLAELETIAESEKCKVGDCTDYKIKIVMILVCSTSGKWIWIEPYCAALSKEITLIAFSAISWRVMQ